MLIIHNFCTGYFLSSWDDHTVEDKNCKIEDKYCQRGVTILL